MMNSWFLFLIPISLAIQTFIVILEFYLALTRTNSYQISSSDYLKGKKYYIGFILILLIRLLVFIFITKSIYVNFLDVDTFTKLYKEDSQFLGVLSFRNFTFYFVFENIMLQNTLYLLIATCINYWIVYFLYVYRDFTLINLIPLIQILFDLLIPRPPSSNFLDTVDLELIPKEIRDYIENKDMTLKAFKKDSLSVNIGIYKISKELNLLFEGDCFGLLSEDELVSILYHEIAHALNNDLLKIRYYDYAFLLIFFIIEYFAISDYQDSIKDTKITDKIDPLIMIFVLLNISICPFLDYLKNYLINLKEIEADRFSVQHSNRSNLISGITKLSLKSGEIFDSSFIFNMIYFNHPDYFRRIKIIQEFGKSDFDNVNNEV